MVDRVSWWVFRGHLAVVLVVGAVLLTLDLTGGEPVTADIGAGLLVFVLLVLGMPWSLLLVVGGPIAGTALSWPAWLGDLALVLVALVNVGLHHALLRRASRRPVAE